MKCEHDFAIWLAGAETTHWRGLLAQGGATHVAINYRGIRLTKKAPWLLAERFEENTEILVDGGGYGAPASMTLDEHDAHNLAYRGWVELNLERMALVQEYDAVDLDWVKSNRAEYWDHIDPDLFVPIWHESYGIPELTDMCNRYRRVGIVKPERNLESKLRSLVASTGVKLHGVGVTKTEDMTRIPYTSVSSTSWITPTKFGDVQVWANGRWHWYPAKTKDASRRRHHVDIEHAGFDPDLIEADDNTEISRYTIWAWLQYEESLAAKHNRSGNVVAIRPGVVPGAGGTSLENSIAQHPSNLPAKRSEKMVFPGMATVRAKVENPQPGEPETTPVIAFIDSGMRRCSSCMLAGKCPAFEPESECAFSFPVEIKTRDQMLHSMTALLEMQLGRIAFARATEEADGGPADQLVSAELRLYFEMVAKLKEIQSDTSFLRIEVRGPTAPSMLSQLLGNHLGPTGTTAAAHQVENLQALDPQRTERYIEDILDIEPEPDPDADG